MSGEVSWALQNGDLDQVKTILPKEKINEQVSNGRPPICIAADYGQLAILEYLVEKGADVNAVDKHGITPLLSAIFEGHTECVRYLLDKGANKLGKAPSGETYIQAAEKNEIKELLK